MGSSSEVRRAFYSFLSINLFLLIILFISWDLGLRIPRASGYAALSQIILLGTMVAEAGGVLFWFIIQAMRWGRKGD